MKVFKDGRIRKVSKNERGKNWPIMNQLRDTKHTTSRALTRINFTSLRRWVHPRKRYLLQEHDES